MSRFKLTAKIASWLSFSNCQEFHIVIYFSVNR